MAHEMSPKELLFTGVNMIKENLKVFESALAGVKVGAEVADAIENIELGLADIRRATEIAGFPVRRPKIGFR